MQGYDIGYTIDHILGELIFKKVLFRLFTDRQSLYGLSISLAHATERCLQTGLDVISEVYEGRDITGNNWIQDQQNPADNMTQPA